MAQRQTRYAAGYQAAMEDIARALADGGESAVLAWLKDNLQTPMPVLDSNTERRASEARADS